MRVREDRSVALRRVASAAVLALVVLLAAPLGAGELPPGRVVVRGGPEQLATTNSASASGN